MKIKHSVFTIVFVAFLSLKAIAQDKKTVGDYRKQIIGEWIFLYTKSDKDSVVEQDIRIEKINFYADNSVSIKGKEKKITGKYQISGNLIKINQIFSGEKNSKDVQFNFTFEGEKKLILIIPMELGSRKLCFEKKNKL
ncbi:MAG: hypothetical protein V4548_04070 [Bacteroidota bacterium]